MTGWRGPIGILVTVGWLFNLVAPAFISSYSSSLAVNAPMMLVMGAIFATKPGNGE